MFILENEKQIEKGLKKARQIKPLVRVLEFGKYAVKGSEGDSYTVRCSRTPQGEKAVECNCKGGLKGLVCYHSISALGIHIVLAEQKQIGK